MDQTYRNAARVDGASKSRIFWRITLPMISPSLFYLVITGFIGAFKAYSDAVALFGTDLNAAGMNTIVGYVYDMLYGASGGYPSYASAAAIILFAIVHIYLVFYHDYIEQRGETSSIIGGWKFIEEEIADKEEVTENAEVITKSARRNE